MRKIVILSSGCILLLSGLFYGWFLKNRSTSEVPAPQAALLTEPKKTAITIPTEPLSNTASPVSSAGDKPHGQVKSRVGTGTAGVKPQHPEVARVKMASQQDSANRISSHPKTLKAPSALDPEEPAQSQTPLGVRLAPDVRLPVAAMPLDFKISPVAQKFLDQIVADYYREVALSASSKDQNGNATSDSSSTTDLIEESETGELTRVIGNSSAVDEARKRADARFKAVFGFKAYNRMTTNSLLEARLPVAPEK